MAQGMSLRTAENYKCKGPKAGVSWAPWREGEGLESAGGRERGVGLGQTTEAPGKVTEQEGHYVTFVLRRSLHCCVGNRLWASGGEAGGEPIRKIHVDQG